MRTATCSFQSLRFQSTLNIGICSQCYSANTKGILYLSTEASTTDTAFD